MSAQTFRRKPETVHGMKLSADNFDEVGAWLATAGFRTEPSNDSMAALLVWDVSLWRVHVGEWIVIVQGEFVIYGDDDELAEHYDPAGRERWQVQDSERVLIGQFDDRQAAFDAIPEYQHVFPNATPMRVQRVIEVDDEDGGG